VVRKGGGDGAGGRHGNGRINDGVECGGGKEQDEEKEQEQEKERRGRGERGEGRAATKEG